MAAAQTAVSLGFFPLVAFFAAFSASASARFACVGSRRAFLESLPLPCCTSCVARSRFFVTVGGMVSPAHEALCRGASRRQRTVSQGTVVLVVAAPGTVLVVATPGTVLLVAAGPVA